MCSGGRSQAVDSEDFDQLMLSKQAEAQQHSLLSDYPVAQDLPNPAPALQPSANMPHVDASGTTDCTPLAGGPQSTAPAPPCATAEAPGQPPPLLERVNNIIDMMSTPPGGAIPLQTQTSGQLPGINPALLLLQGWPFLTVLGTCSTLRNAPASVTLPGEAVPSSPDQCPKASTSEGTTADRSSEEPSSNSGRGQALQDSDVCMSAISDTSVSEGPIAHAEQAQQPPNRGLKKLGSTVASHRPEDAAESLEMQSGVTPRASGTVLKELTPGQADSRGNSFHKNQSIPCTPRASKKATEKPNDRGQAARKTPVSKSKLGGSKRSISVRSPAGTQSAQGNKDKPGRPSKLSRKELQYKEQ